MMRPQVYVQARVMSSSAAATFQSDIDGDGTCQFFCPFEFFRWKKRKQGDSIVYVKLKHNFKGPHHLPDPPSRPCASYPLFTFLTRLK